MVLTDIMMPIMDGYELIKKIRSQRRFAQLPILALTAKAMREDRDRCIEAGASDYITKPIDIDRLLSLMRVWMYR
jgi:CheY-like chemotaxis protein